MKIKAIIFDADGMIVHGERFSRRLAQEFGISTETTASFFRNEFQLCLVGKADLRKELAKHLQEWGWEKSVDDLLDFWFAEDHTKIDTRFLEVIQDLKAMGIATYIATNNEKYRTDNLMKKRGLENWVDAIFSSAYLGFKKPEAGFFQKMIEAIGMDKGQVVFWDDDTENIQGASALGLRAELFNDFDAFREKVMLM